MAGWSAEAPTPVGEIPAGENLVGELVGPAGRIPSGVDRNRLGESLVGHSRVTWPAEGRSRAGWPAKDHCPAGSSGEVVATKGVLAGPLCGP
ncbi:MAG TPA: hypothetical protein VKZ67_13330 [Natronosporangium sp.]|nr:hypothetical protein [Natronosporangium sp.]